jgi:flagellar biosynthetic protein FliP
MHATTHAKVHAKVHAIIRASMPVRGAVLVLVALLGAMVLGTAPALAQSELGPPAPDAIVSPAQRGAPAPQVPDVAAPPPATVRSLNPLEVLDIAGDSIASRRAQTFDAGLVPVPPGAATSGGGSQRSGLSTALNILVLLTIVSLAPSIMLMTTCFLRILVVLGLLRQALGVQGVPPPQVITALSLFMTLLVMSPTLDRINAEAIQPYRDGQITDYDQLWSATKQPVRDFMFAQIEASGNWSSLYMVLEYRGVDVSRPEVLTREHVDMVSLVPAYMLSELKVAFLMGFKLYLPFLVIDMVISMMLIAMSMMMLPPVLVSLPFKLLLFVLVDGWALVVGGLLVSFQQPHQMAEVAMALPDLVHGGMQGAMHAGGGAAWCALTEWAGAVRSGGAVG